MDSILTLSAGRNRPGDESGGFDTFIQEPKKFYFPHAFSLNIVLESNFRVVNAREFQDLLLLL